MRQHGFGWLDSHDYVGDRLEGGSGESRAAPDVERSPAATAGREPQPARDEIDDVRVDSRT
jgi:hypothetical protein